MQLKTKLVIAISGMVLALVSVLSYIYLSQLMRQRMAAAYDVGDLVAHQIYHVSRDALELDFIKVPEQSTPEATRKIIEETLQTDPSVNSMLQAIVGYSPIIDYVAIADVNNRALLHTDSFLQGQPMERHPEFAQVLNAGFWRQLQVVYGKPQVYEIKVALSRNQVPFGEVRLGVQSVFIANELRPQLDRTFSFAALSIVISFVLAAALSNIALRPLEAIAARLDRMTAGEIEPIPEDKPKVRSDEYGVVSTKIDTLGRQMRDVKEVFSALKENLDQLMANLQDGLMLFTRDWRVVLVSASAERFVGLSRTELLGNSVDEIFSQSSRLGQVILDAFHQHLPLFEQEVELETGRRINVSLDFIEEGAEKIGALLIVRDAESVRRIEDEIELSRRLAAIGRLTSGVAHEVKNPINAIVLHLEVLRQKLPALELDTSRHLDVISNEIQRLDRVVQTLVDFTRPVELRLIETDVRRTLEDVALLASPDANKRGIKIVKEIPAEPLRVRIDSDLVKQALLNVVLNGIQAMAEGGELSLSASRDGDAIEIRIRDQGKGIPADIQDKIFNLYFTTKKGGSGIGLAMTYRVMQLHNGSLEFESIEGVGTTFILQFPASQPLEVFDTLVAQKEQSAAH